MENASKALLIAGAILVTILIVSLGIMVYNNAKGQAGDGNLDKQTMEAFNSDFDVFVGSKKTATEVKSLCSKVIASNATEKANGKAKYIKVTGASINITESGTATTTTVPVLDNSKTYTIKISKYTNGVVSEIIVTQE